jgi:hypothetical protein
MDDNNKSRTDEQKFQDDYYERMAEVYKDAESLSTEGGAIFNDLDAYFEQDHLSDEDKALLAQLDAIDVANSDMVEFTDDDIYNQAVLMGKMTELRGHANNVEYCSYTYMINVYEQSELGAGTFKCSRIYEFENNETLNLNELFRDCHFIHRSTTTSLGATTKPYGIHTEERIVNVYDLVVPVGFDIDATHYFYNERIVSFEPWLTVPKGWDTHLRDDYNDLHDDLIRMNKFKKTEILHLTMKDTTPHVLDTRSPLPMHSINVSE